LRQKRAHGGAGVDVDVDVDVGVDVDVDVVPARHDRRVRLVVRGGLVLEADVRTGHRREPRTFAHV
jgi:hypothetical protein